MRNWGAAADSCERAEPYKEYSVAWLLEAPLQVATLFAGPGDDILSTARGIQHLGSSARLHSASLLAKSNLS